MSSSVAQAGPSAVIAVDVGKTTAAVLVSDAGRRRLLGPVECSMTGSGVSQLIGKIRGVISATGVTRVGVEAAGHYHRPLLSGWPLGWEVVELNPAHVTEQRRVWAGGG
jgi:transposase